MEQQVQVVRIQDKLVEVSAGVVETIFGKRERRYWAANPKNLALKRGTWIEVGQKNSLLALEAGLLFLLPSFLVFLFYQLSATAFAGNVSQGIRVFLSLLGLPLGGFIFKILRTKLPTSFPEVFKILEEEPEVAQGCGNGCVCRVKGVQKNQQ